MHAVRFYETSAALVRTVAGFIIEGLEAGDPALVIATAEHRRLILQAVGAAMNVERLERDGDLIVLDANEALAMLMVDGMPEPKRFEENILPLIDKVSNRRMGSVMRIYGEMVDVLWKQGREAAALRLELLGNHLAQIRRVSILCGYSMQNSYSADSFGAICREHTHAVSADGVAVEIGAGGTI